MKTLALSACIVFGLFQAQAATITNFTRAQFQNAINGASITQQNFDLLSNGTLLGTLGGVTYAASGGTPVVTNSYLTTTPPNGLGSTSLGYFGATETATFTFAAAITAFAIDINTFAPSVGAYSATLNIGDVILSGFDVFPGNVTGQFIGFTSSLAFTSVVITPLSVPSNITPFAYTLDTLVYGDASQVISSSAIPEPATALFLVPALLALAITARKR